MSGIPLSWHRFCAVGLRGAIAFALSLHLEFEQEKRYVLVTATLIIVLFTVIFLGGMTLPLMKVLNNREYIIRHEKKIQKPFQTAKNYGTLANKDIQSNRYGKHIWYFYIIQFSFS